MAASPTGDCSRFAPYRLPVGLGLLVVGVLVLLLAQGTVLDDTDWIRRREEASGQSH